MKTKLTKHERAMLEIRARDLKFSTKEWVSLDRSDQVELADTILKLLALIPVGEENDGLQTQGGITNGNSHQSYR